MHDDAGVGDFRRVYGVQSMTTPVRKAAAGRKHPAASQQAGSEGRPVADLPPSATAARRFALVMSGGGARGAYEAGVLGYILDELPRRLGRPVRFEIVTGTSVGAIHACYVASTQGRPHAGRGLAQIWRALHVGGVYRVGIRDALGIPLRLLGLSRSSTEPAEDGIPERLSGLLDTTALERLVQHSIAWDDLRRNIDSGEIDAVAVAATEISSGKSIVWVDNRERAVRPWRHDPFVVARPMALGPQHALASAAIPFIFPAPRIDGGYFCDGGLRLNTPLAPALRLGADRLLIIGLRHPPTPEEEAALSPHRESNYSSLAYLGGKVLNALLLDHVDYDVDRLRLVNAILDTGVRAYGPEFMQRINAVIEEMRGTPYKVVRNVYLLPSRDLGVIAADCFAHHHSSGGLRNWISNTVARYAVHGIAEEADLLSYLYFDECYIRHLLELGHHDAAVHADELLAFFRDESRDAEGADDATDDRG
jgi:NTE family protein